MSTTTPLTTDDELRILRDRVHVLEEAIESWVTVMEETAEQRRVAYERVVAALTTDWRTAVVCDRAMTPEQRAQWLAHEQVGTSMGEG